MTRPKQRVIVYRHGVVKGGDLPGKLNAIEKRRATRESRGVRYEDCISCGRRVALRSDGSFRTHGASRHDALIKCKGERNAEDGL